MGLSSRLQHAWNAFMNRDPTNYIDYGFGTTYKPDRPRMTRGNERSIVTSVYNRIAMDVASVRIVHARLDSEDRFKEIIPSGLNNCLTLSANIDQTGRTFIQDVVLSLMDEGCVAIVPVDTTINPYQSSSYDINSMRTGKILEWHPRHIKVQVYDDRIGHKQEIMLPKDNVAIIENPLYAVINEPNSTNQRLIRKLNLLDAIDEQSGAGKLDLVIQLPYVIKSDARKVQAENRRREIEDQLNGSKYGIAYTDGTEKITQLNRSIDNNLMKQIEYLTSMLYSQLGITTTVLDGTADEKTMLNYTNRTIEPIISAITDELTRKFLTKTARSQKQTIMFFNDPFKLVPVADLAEIADKFTRNEIMSSNEIRQIIGRRPVDDQRADELRNKNLNAPAETAVQDQSPTSAEYISAMNDLDELDSQLDDLENELNADDKLQHYASPYYDPVKAHEYYMQNRELKGRKSTSGLNEEGRNAASYVKKQLTNERKQKVESNKEQTNANIEQLKEQKNTKIEAHKNAMQAKIDSLRTQLKNGKNSNSERIQSQIAFLREANSQERERLQKEYVASSTNLRTAHKEESSRLKDEYDEKYLQELDKIRSETKFQKVSKKKSKKSKS